MYMNYGQMGAMMAMAEEIGSQKASNRVTKTSPTLDVNGFFKTDKIVQQKYAKIRQLAYDMEKLSDEDKKKQSIQQTYDDDWKAIRRDREEKATQRRIKQEKTASESATVVAIAIAFILAFILAFIIFM